MSNPVHTLLTPFISYEDRAGCMSGPIVPLPTLEQIVPEHCSPLWEKKNILVEGYNTIVLMKKREQSLVKDKAY